MSDFKEHFIPQADPDARCDRIPIQPGEGQVFPNRSGEDGVTLSLQSQDAF